MANPNPTYKIPKGTTPNPNGRPKKEWTMAGLIEQALEIEHTTGKPKKQVIAEKLAELAMRGDMQAIREINNRMDGMPMQRTDITSKDEKVEGLLIYQPEKKPEMENGEAEERDMETVS